MKFRLSEKFNNDMNDVITKKSSSRLGKITQADIDRLNDDFMEDITECPIDESLNKKSSLKYHYKKHVLKQSDKRVSGNRDKYDYMSINDYYNYAKSIITLVPTNIIDTSLVDKDDISDEIDFFLISGTVLKIDYNLINKIDNKPMYAIFNKNSKYSKFIELCLVDKATNEPITAFPLVGGRFNKYMKDFLGI